MNTAATPAPTRRIFVVSGPGGVGKGTLVRAVTQGDESLHLMRSWTSRERRKGEASDAYVFVSREQFEAHIANGGFLEWVEFLGNYYGTPTPPDVGDRSIVLEIELEGAQIVKRAYPDAVLILIAPPSEEVQRQRLAARGDSPHVAEQRVKKGQEELALGRRIADHVVVNDDLTQATEELRAILTTPVRR